MAWRLAYSLEQLRAELNATFPNRDKSSDGTIGDQSHAASASDHNPNAAGVVCAFDIDTDLDGTNNSSDPQMDKLTDWFRTRPQRDIKYLIYNGRMFSAYPAQGYPPFTWRPYSGSDPHRSHAHVSVGVGKDGQSVQPYDDRDSWGVAACFSSSSPPRSTEDQVTLHYARLEESPAVYLVSTVSSPRPIVYFADADYWTNIEGNKITEAGGDVTLGPDPDNKTRKGILVKRGDNRARELFGFPRV